jgi:hypothetical protein
MISHLVQDTAVIARLILYIQDMAFRWVALGACRPILTFSAPGLKSKQLFEERSHRPRMQGDRNLFVLWDGLLLYRKGSPFFNHDGNLSKSEERKLQTNKIEGKNQIPRRR